jgi:hypothetical protein
MANADASTFRRRRLIALGVLAALIAGIWGIPQLLANTGQEVLPVAEETQSAEPQSTEITECAPGVVSVVAIIGRVLSTDDSGKQEVESLNSFARGTQPHIWYEITNNGLVDCTFNVGDRATFFTITSGEQTYWSSRDCDRSADKDLYITLKANEPMVADADIWERTYSSENGCNLASNSEVPGGGATYKIKVEVNGVISEETRFLLN